MIDKQFCPSARWCFCGDSDTGTCSNGVCVQHNAEDSLIEAERFGIDQGKRARQLRKKMLAFYAAQSRCAERLDSVDLDGHGFKPDRKALLRVQSRRKALIRPTDKLEMQLASERSKLLMIRITEVVSRGDPDEIAHMVGVMAAGADYILRGLEDQFGRKHE